jgi:DNA-binding Xre family transcriptional regulator
MGSTATLIGAHRSYQPPNLPSWFWPVWPTAWTIPRVQEDLQRFGKNVREARLARGWTQEDLAAASELAVGQISRIERGVREIRLTTLLSLLKALKVPPKDLLRGLY